MSALLMFMVVLLALYVRDLIYALHDDFVKIIRARAERVRKEREDGNRFW